MSVERKFTSIILRGPDEERTEIYKTTPTPKAQQTVRKRSRKSKRIGVSAVRLSPSNVRSYTPTVSSTRLPTLEQKKDNRHAKEKRESP